MPHRFHRRFARWLRHPRLAIGLAIVAVVLSLPALWVGWQLDDHYQRLVLTGSPASAA